VENDYVGSPCGLLDQIMILFAREGMGTHYRPGEDAVSHLRLGGDGGSLRIVVLDTGTVRPGLEKSTYRQRRAECEELVDLLRAEHGISRLADVRSPELLRRILDAHGEGHPGHCQRLEYIHRAQARFFTMLEAWKAGDVETVGRVFREDGIELRDLYRISGPELETMCDIARTVPGVLGERMLGGGDKGAAGALVRADSVAALEQAVGIAFPRSHPELADSFAVHVCRLVEGIAVLDRGCLGGE
jgi:galactokinase